MSKAKVLSLYRDVLRASHEFEYYNFREYFLRKARRDFRLNKDTSGDVKQLYKDGVKELHMLRRQSLITQMYPVQPLVVEKKDEHHHHWAAATKARTLEPVDVIVEKETKKED